METNTKEDQRSVSSLSVPNQTVEADRPNAANTDDGAFVNHGLVLWTAQRREWTGNQQKARLPGPEKPVVRHDTNFEILSSTSGRLVKPIPLSEVIKYLTSTWEREGLF